MPLKPLTKDEDLSAIPVDEPVLVELEPPPTGEVVEPDKPARAEKPLKTEGKPEGDEDAGVKALQKEMEAMAKATASETARLTRERDEALRRVDEAHTSRAEAEADAVQSALKAAQDEQKSARGALKAAQDSGDPDAMADAVERLGRASSQISNLERDAAVLASETERDKQERERRAQAPQQHTDVNAFIEQMPGLMSAEKAWLKEHTDAVTDPARRTELDAAYFKAMRKGIGRGTDAYFKFVEKEMGYADEGEDDNPNNDEQEHRVMPAAPVSRDSRSVLTGKPTLKPGQVYLSPEQRQVARDMGISDKAYAEGVRKLEAEKRRDPERFNARA